MLRREFDSRQVHNVMATQQSFIDYVLDQTSSLRGVSVRKMFGEYALYYQGKVVALVCENTVFVKLTEQGKSFSKDEYKEGFPYPGAKSWIRVSEENLENSDWLVELISITAEHVSPVRIKKKRSV